MAKRDHKGKTGKSGGKDVQFDEVDLIILDILGSDSPMIEGLAVPEPSGSNLIQPISMAIPSESPQSAPTVPSFEPQATTPPSNSTKQKKRVNPSLDDEETVLRKNGLSYSPSSLSTDIVSVLMPTYVS
jgi:hypothetical protein